MSPLVLVDPAFARSDARLFLRVVLGLVTLALAECHRLFLWVLPLQGRMLDLASAWFLGSWPLPAQILQVHDPCFYRVLLLRVPMGLAFAESDVQPLPLHSSLVLVGHAFAKSDVRPVPLRSSRALPPPLQSSQIDDPYLCGVRRQMTPGSVECSS